MKVINQKWCTACKRKGIRLIKNASYIRKDGIKIQYHRCRDCNNKKSRKYYSNNKTKCQYIASKSYVKHTNKQIARATLAYAISCGDVKKPKKCEVCGKTKKLQGHHEDYSKPIEVLWVCIPCHSDIHKK